MIEGILCQIGIDSFESLEAWKRIEIIMPDIEFFISQSSSFEIKEASKTRQMTGNPFGEHIECVEKWVQAWRGSKGLDWLSADPKKEASSEKGKLFFLMETEKKP